jgi:hypothetical protein
VTATQFEKKATALSFLLPALALFENMPLLSHLDLVT